MIFGRRILRLGALWALSAWLPALAAGQTKTSGQDAVVAPAPVVGASALGSDRFSTSLSAASLPPLSGSLKGLPSAPIPQLAPSVLTAAPERPEAAASQAAAPPIAPTPSLAAGLKSPQASGAERKASPIQGLLENAPLAGAAASQKDLSTAREGSGANFYQAARLESAAAGPAAAVEPSGEPAGPAPASGLRPALLGASPAEQKALDEVSRAFGPIIARADAPVLYAALDAMFSRLSAAQQKLFPADAVSINHICVIDAPLDNAFVYPIQTPGVRRSSNMVFITTGLLKKMLGDAPAGLKDGLVRVAGVLSHELAHPLDDMDRRGIQNSFGRQIGSQAREIRADSEGAMIAKEAGYPVASVYEGLKRLFTGQAAGSIGGSLVSTHPQNDLRLAMQRMLLTMDRYEKGTHVPSYPEDSPAAILAELVGIDQGAAAGRFVFPRDLAEALDRLKELSGLSQSQLKRSDAYKILEFNRLVLSVDAMLAEKGADLSDEEFNLFTGITRILTQLPGPPIMDREGMNRLFARGSYSEEFLSYPSHETFMKKVPAYNSERYLDWARANFLTRSYGDGYSTGMDLRGLARILPSERLFAAFADRLAAATITDMRAQHRSRLIYEQNLAEGKSIEFQARLAVFFHQKILPQLSAEERLAFFIEGTGKNYSYVFPRRFSIQGQDYSLGILRQRGLFMGDPHLKSLQADYRAVLQSIWDNRGYYGVLDLVLQYNATDWDSLFAALGIDPQAGRSQLRQAVKQFCGTPDYATIVSDIQTSNLGVFGPIKIGDVKTKPEALGWLDDTLGAFLDGSFNETLKGAPALRSAARKVFAGAYYQSRPEAFRRAYGSALAEALARQAGKPMAFAELAAAHRAVMDALVGGSRFSVELGGTQAEAIDRSALPAATKQALLRAVFLEGYNEAELVGGLSFDQPGAWLPLDAGSARTIARILIKNGLAPDTLGLFEQLLAREDYRWAAKANNYISYALVVSRFKAELLGDLEKALSSAAPDPQKAAVLQRFLEVVADPADGEYADARLLNTPELRDMKARAARLASGLDIPFKSSLRLFQRLTGSGATPAADAFFQKRLEPAFDDKAAASAGLPLAAILESGRIEGSGLQLALTRRVLEPEVERLKSRPQDPGALNRLIETINAYVRQGSLKKDEYLESLAWSLGLSGRELGAFIEDEKSYNWRKGNPMLLRFGSALSAEIAKLSRRAREDFIAFLIEPEGRELPAPILKELQRSAYEEALASDDGGSRVELRKNTDRAAYLMKLEIESALLGASPFERIPLFELLLSAGAQALQNDANFPHNVTRAFLRYEPGSTEETMLDSYLSVVPAHERTVSLAYLLSQAGENKSSVKSIFEVFQTVGVKFGQLSSIWKLFGEEVAQETASLKNDARPMSKAEIEEAMRRELTPGEFSRIRLKKVIGSASLKTVALVELEDGREAVMLLRRPHAAEQIENNLRLGQEFLRELDRRGMSEASAMFDAVLDAVRQQLAEELKLTKEAESILTAKRYFEGLNSSMRAQLNGWRFEVPGLVAGFQVRDSILFMEKAGGTTYDKLTPQTRSQAGPLIVESSLRLLFREGWFDADRHTGNQLIDPEQKVIYPIDFGQAEAYSRKGFWQSDERYELAQFLRAFSEGDADRVLSHGRSMSKAGGPADFSALRDAVRKTLAGEGSLSDRLIALVAAFTEQGVRLDGKFTFGAFKGLMTLYGESYMSDEGFRALLSREISSLLKRKLPKTLADDRLSRQ